MKFMDMTDKQQMSWINCRLSQSLDWHFQLFWYKWTTSPKLLQVKWSL